MAQESYRNRCLKLWSWWLAWCQEHDLAPDMACPSDVNRFIAHLHPDPANAEPRQQG